MVGSEFFHSLLAIRYSLYFTTPTSRKYFITPGWISAVFGAGPFDGFLSRGEFVAIKIGTNLAGPPDPLRHSFLAARGAPTAENFVVTVIPLACAMNEGQKCFDVIHRLLAGICAGHHFMISQNSMSKPCEGTLARWIVQLLVREGQGAAPALRLLHPLNRVTWTGR